MACQSEAGYLSFEPGVEFVGKIFEFVQSGLQMGFGNPAGFAERNDKGDVFGAGAASVFLARAEQQRRQIDATPDVQRANAFGRIELVSGDREQVDAEFIDVDRDLSNRLRRVGVDRRAPPSRRGADVSDRLQRAGLVLGMDNRRERSVVVDRSDEFLPWLPRPA
jgi:hypothetical protein